MPHRSKNWNSNRSRRSTFSSKQFEKELHELLEIPMNTIKSSGGFWYERPLVGQRILKAIIKSMVDALQRGESISIQGFGTWRVETVKVRSGGTIRATDSNCNIIGDTKTSIPHPPKQKVIFYPSTHLQAMVNAKAPNVPNAAQKEAMKSWSLVNED